MFAPVPTWCLITYSYTVAHPDGVAAVAFDSDPAARQFTFSYSADLDLCGLVSTDYVVTVIGEIGITEK